MELADIEKYRDTDGFIDVDKCSEIYNVSKIVEKRGSSNKEKDWFCLDDGKVLLRTENLQDENVDYVSYAELIVEELSKQVKIPCAHYDLIKYKGKRGVLSKNVLKNDNQSLILAKTLFDSFGIDYIPNCDMSIDDVFECYSKLNKFDNISQKQLQELNFDTAQMAIFDIFTMATDRHAENFGIIYDNDGLKQNVSLSPMFDNECSLMLDSTREDIEDMLEDKSYLKEKVCLQNQLITVPDDAIDEENFDWQNMLYYLCDNSEKCMEFAEYCAEKLDINEAIKNVEGRINIELPESLVQFCGEAFKIRKEEIEKTLLIEEPSIEK